MKTVRIALTALALLATLSQSALSQQVWQEQRITNTSWGEWAPKVYGDRVYYVDRRNTNGEVYVWDQAHGSRRVFGGDGMDRGVWAVSGETLVTARFVNNQYDLYTWDPVNGERAISTAPGDQKNASMFGDTVVYENWESGRPQVYMYDPVNGNKPLFASSTWQEDPQISDSRVVWNDSQYGTYMWTPGAGAVRLGGGTSPAVYGDKVVNWTLGHNEWNGNGYTLIPGYLWEWTPAGGWKKLAQHSFTDWSDVQSTHVWGSLVVWQSGIDLARVRSWDPIHGHRRISESTYGWNPVLYGNKVAWRGMGAEGRGDIYLSTMVPEPSSLLALAGGVGFLLLRGRKKMTR